MSETKHEEAQATRYRCCGTSIREMGDTRSAWPCGSMMRRHPVIAAAICAVMGLAALLVPAGAILGIIAFFRTI